MTPPPAAPGIPALLAQLAALLQGPLIQELLASKAGTWDACRQFGQQSQKIYTWINNPSPVDRGCTICFNFWNITQGAIQTLFFSDRVESGFRRCYLLASSFLVGCASYQNGVILKVDVCGTDTSYMMPSPHTGPCTWVHFLICQGTETSFISLGWKLSKKGFLHNFIFLCLMSTPSLPLSGLKSPKNINCGVFMDFLSFLPLAPRDKAVVRSILPVGC